MGKEVAPGGTGEHYEAAPEIEWEDCHAAEGIA